MNNEALKYFVFDSIFTLLKDDFSNIIITDETPLIGEGGLLDSMKLVELCLALEDKSIELGFEFDWTSEMALSKSRGMFRTAGSLASEFANQINLQK